MQTVIEQLHQEIDQLPEALAQEVLNFLLARRRLQEAAPIRFSERQMAGTRSDYLDALLKNPLKVPGFKPLSREECHDRPGFRG